MAGEPRSRKRKAVAVAVTTAKRGPRVLKKTITVTATGVATAERLATGQHKHVRDSNALVERLSDALEAFETLVAKQAARIRELEAEVAQLRTGRGP